MQLRRTLRTVTVTAAPAKLHRRSCAATFAGAAITVTIRKALLNCIRIASYAISMLLCRRQAMLPVAPCPGVAWAPHGGTQGALGFGP